MIYKRNVTVIVECERNFDAGVITKEPTTTEPGEKTYVCKYCKHTRRDRINPLPAPEVTPVETEAPEATPEATTVPDEENGIDTEVSYSIKKDGNICWLTVNVKNMGKQEFPN